MQMAIARREVGRLFQLYLAAFPECTQTQLALLTEHDRSDISNFVRGARCGQVSDIEVLSRIADGVRMPDDARVLLGLAPAAAPLSALRAARATIPDAEGTKAGSITTGWLQTGEHATEHRIAICGSRAAGTDPKILDDMSRSLGRLLMRCPCRVSHGPVGIGIEVMTYIADHYRPPNLNAAVGRFGHLNVVRDADYVLVIGGGQGTQDEADLAFSMDKRIIPMPASGGTARHVYVAMRRNGALRRWMTEEHFVALERCSDADEYTRMVERALASDWSHG
ncbi:MAG: hypothetical protein ACRDYA_20255 [Egibacteraceae bacterium]